MCGSKRDQTQLGIWNNSKLLKMKLIFLSSSNILSHVHWRNKRILFRLMFSFWTHRKHFLTVFIISYPLIVINTTKKYLASFKLKLIQAVLQVNPSQHLPIQSQQFKLLFLLFCSYNNNNNNNNIFTIYVIIFCICKYVLKLHCTW